jgi:hypothetical protein
MFNYNWAKVTILKRFIGFSLVLDVLSDKFNGNIQI